MTTPEIRDRLEASPEASSLHIESGQAGGNTGRLKGTAAIVAAVAAALVGTTLVVRHNDSARTPGSIDNASSAGATTSEAGVLEPTTVGRARAIVSVPGGWGRNEFRCGVAMADTVVFQFDGGRACAMASSGFDSVTIGSAAGYDPNAETTRTTENGVDVYTASRRGQAGFTVIEMVVPEEDAWFLIRVRDSELAQEIGDSLRILPGDQTTMPDVYLGATGGRPGYSAAPGPVEVKRRLEHAGLTVTVRYVGDATPDHWSSLKTDRDPGVVLPVGTRITVTYSVGPKTR